ncbi:uncharacterized protein LOC107815872 [Nicotiana tabacum]|uniref:Uncharacterized protein LOC107815872 n=1 Tax=Nicotiana tabacum TaxID=4097 RepID=A0A1S4C7T4_TOBAC|nr:PREDICTED: uncharacterized protein LOC107815872 [Nicotiana tabacum]
MTWHKKIPFKWSFCLWRVIKNKLPTDDGVLSFCSPTVTRCVCCSFHTNETIDHLFSRGNFARIVWNKFEGPVGIQTEEFPLRLLLMRWWLLHNNNEVQKLILHYLPIIVCWNLWKNRYIAKYGAKSTSLTRVLFSINSDINMLLRANFLEVKWPLNWQELYPFIENLKHQTFSAQVVWSKPSHGYVKVNNDGSALTNRGRIGVGVIIRDHYSEFIHASAAPLGEGTNNFVKTEAALIGIQWCLNNGFTKVHLESNSALLIQWLTSGRNFPWSLKMKLHQLLDLCNLCESFKCSHTYREAKCPADSLSKLNHDLTTITEYHNASALPTHIRGLILQDYLSTPAFRHKRTRRILVPPHHARSSTSSHGYG